MRKIGAQWVSFPFRELVKEGRLQSKATPANPTPSGMIPASLHNVRQSAPRTSCREGLLHSQQAGRGLGCVSKAWGRKGEALSHADHSHTPGPAGDVLRKNPGQKSPSEPYLGCSKGLQ